MSDIQADAVWLGWRVAAGRLRISNPPIHYLHRVRAIFQWSFIRANYLIVMIRILRYRCIDSATYDSDFKLQLVVLSWREWRICIYQVWNLIQSRKKSPSFFPLRIQTRGRIRRNVRAVTSVTTILLAWYCGGYGVYVFFATMILLL